MDRLKELIKWHFVWRPQWWLYSIYDSILYHCLLCWEEWFENFPYAFQKVFHCATLWKAYFNDFLLPLFVNVCTEYLSRIRRAKTLRWSRLFLGTYLRRSATRYKHFKRIMYILFFEIISTFFQGFLYLFCAGYDVNFKFSEYRGNCNNSNFNSTIFGIETA